MGGKLGSHLTMLDSEKRRCTSGPRHQSQRPQHPVFHDPPESRPRRLRLRGSRRQQHHRLQQIPREIRPLPLQFRQPLRTEFHFSFNLLACHAPRPMSPGRGNNTPPVTPGFPRSRSATPFLIHLHHCRDKQRAECERSQIGGNESPPEGDRFNEPSHGNHCPDNPQRDTDGFGIHRCFSDLVVSTASARIR